VAYCGCCRARCDELNPEIKLNKNQINLHHYSAVEHRHQQNVVRAHSNIVTVRHVVRFVVHNTAQYVVSVADIAVVLDAPAYDIVVHLTKHKA
jgi:hypothetical protein